MKLMVTGRRMGKTTEAMRMLKEDKLTAVVVHNPVRARQVCQEFQLTAEHARRLIVWNEIKRGDTKGMRFNKVIFEDIDQLLQAIAWDAFGPVNEVLATATATMWEPRAAVDVCGACLGHGVIHTCGKVG